LSEVSRGFNEIAKRESIAIQDERPQSGVGSPHILLGVQSTCRSGLRVCTAPMANTLRASVDNVRGSESNEPVHECARTRVRSSVCARQPGCLRGSGTAMRVLQSTGQSIRSVRTSGRASKYALASSRVQRGSGTRTGSRQIGHVHHAVHPTPAQHFVYRSQSGRASLGRGEPVSLLTEYNVVVSGLFLTHCTLVPDWLL
jgi:hypothetical protein